jgi:hypothetical protein
MKGDPSLRLKIGYAQDDPKWGDAATISEARQRGSQTVSSLAPLIYARAGCSGVEDGTGKGST